MASSGTTLRSQQPALFYCLLAFLKKQVYIKEISIILPSEIWSWCTRIQPSRVHSTENKTAQITKRCKLARSITAKTCKTNGCKTRGVCISYCTVRAVTITQSVAYNFCDSTQTLFYLINTSRHFPSARLYTHKSAHAPTHPPVS